MLCARDHSGSSVSAGNSPESTGPSRRVANPPPNRLSNRASSHTSSTSSGPATSTSAVPLVTILKIGPYCCAIRTKPPSGSAVSMSNTLPTTGSGRGPGISSRGTGAIGSGATTTVLLSTGPRDHEAHGEQPDRERRGGRVLAQLTTPKAARPWAHPSGRAGHLFAYNPVDQPRPRP